MLSSQELEYQLWRFVQFDNPARWSSTRLGEFCNAVHCTDHQELVDTLKRLHGQGRIELQKWKESEQRFRPYDRALSDEEFFYRHDFQLKVSPEGRPYFEALEQERMKTTGGPDPASQPNIIGGFHTMPSNLRSSGF